MKYISNTYGPQDLRKTDLFYEYRETDAYEIQKKSYYTIGFTPEEYDQHVIEELNYKHWADE